MYKNEKHLFEPRKKNFLVLSQVRPRVVEVTPGGNFGNIKVTYIVQGHSERMLKVNPFAWALIFTKSGFSGVFWDEK